MNKGDFYEAGSLWIRLENEGRKAVVGLTEQAEMEFGMILYVDLPDPGMDFESGELLLTVETAFAETELMSPLRGKVLRVNRELEREPGMIHAAPYGRGWLLEMEVDVDASQKIEP